MSEAPHGDLAAAMGIELVELTPERAVGTMPVAGNRQPIGVLHGGAHCVLAETLASAAAAVHAGEGRTAFGIELSASYHRPAFDGTLTGVATAIVLGRTLCTHDVRIHDDAGRHLSTVRVTNILRDLPQQPPQVSR